MSFQRTQYYPQDSDLLIYSSCQMSFLGWRVQITRQQILWSFKTLKTRKKDLQSLCKLNVETVNLSIAFILHLRLTMGNDNPSRGMKTMEITIRVSEVSGLVIHHLLSCAVSWTCLHQWPKMHVMAYLIL